MEIEIIENYQDSLINDGKAPLTIQSYLSDVRQFLQYLEEQNHVFKGDIPRFAFNSYLQSFHRKNSSPATINKKVNSLLSFNHFLISEGLMKGLVIHSNKDKVKTAYGSQKEVTTLSQIEIDKLLFFIQNNPEVTIRNRLIIYLLLYTGVRVSELINIKRENIDPIARYLTIEHGKGGVTREIPLKHEVLDLIDMYIHQERSASPFLESPYLLLTQRAPKLHRDAVNRMLNGIGNNLDIHLHPHIFRHTFCTQLLRKGVLITTVSKLAGHSDINVTASFYLSTSREEKLSAVDLL